MEFTLKHHDIFTFIRSLSKYMSADEIKEEFPTQYREFTNTYDINRYKAPHEQYLQIFQLRYYNVKPQNIE